MSLGNPFCTTAGYNQKLEGNRIQTGFGSLNNYFRGQQGDAIIGANGAGFPYDVYGLRPHISLIFLFTEESRIKSIEGSTFRTQIGAGAGAERTTGTTRLLCRLVGLRGLGTNQEILRRTVFDPLGWDKTDPVIRANAAGLGGINYEFATAWEGNPVGRIYQWDNADIFYDKLITRDENFAFETNIIAKENDVLLMTPAYSDRNLVDTANTLPLNVFMYAGSPPPTGGGTDYRNFQVLRTLRINGEIC